MATAPRKILIAMDGSEQSLYAFDWFMQYFYKDRDDVIIAYSAESARLGTAPIPSTDPNFVAKLAREEEEDIVKLVTNFQELITNAGIKGRVLRVTGPKPGEAIVKAGEDFKVDIILAGSRGLGTIRRTLMGSVSEYIVHHAKVPVVVVKKPPS